MEIVFNMALSLGFGVVGIIILILGYKLFDKLIPADFNKELENGNMAIAILLAGVLVSLAIIVSQVVR